MGVRHLAQGPDQAAGALQVRRHEIRAVRPNPVGRAVEPVVPARQQPLAERAVGDDQPPVPLGVGNQVFVGLPRDEAVAHLVAQHPGAECVLGLPPAAQRVVADPDLADQARALQCAHAAHDDGLPEKRVGLVHLVEIDPADAEPMRARHGPPPDDGRKRRDRKDLRGEEYLVSATADRLAEDPLAASEPVDFGGVQQGHAKLQRAPHDSPRLLLGVWLTVSPFTGPELPGSEPYLGDLRGCVNAQVPHDHSIRYSPGGHAGISPALAVRASGRPQFYLLCAGCLWDQQVGVL